MNEKPIELPDLAGAAQEMFRLWAEHKPTLPPEFVAAFEPALANLVARFNDVVAEGRAAVEQFREVAGLQHADSSKNPPKIVAEPLPRRANTSREQFRQIQRQPAIESGAATAGQSAGVG